MITPYNFNQENIDSDMSDFLMATKSKAHSQEVLELIFN